MTEFEYEYVSASQKWTNPNTNIIQLPKNDRIGIEQKFQNVEKCVCNWRPSSQKNWTIERLWKEKLLSSNSFQIAQMIADCHNFPNVYDML